MHRDAAFLSFSFRKYFSRIRNFVFSNFVFVFSAKRNNFSRAESKRHKSTIQSSANNQSKHRVGGFLFSSYFICRFMHTRVGALKNPFRVKIPDVTFLFWGKRILFDIPDVYHIHYWSAFDHHFFFHLDSSHVINNLVPDAQIIHSKSRQC